MAFRAAVRCIGEGGARAKGSIRRMVRSKGASRTSPRPFQRQQSLLSTTITLDNNTGNEEASLLESLLESDKEAKEEKESVVVDRISLSLVSNSSPKESMLLHESIVEPALIGRLKDKQQLEALVATIESVPNLTRDEIFRWVRPLMVATSRLATNSSGHEHVGAQLTERLLFKALDHDEDYVNWTDNIIRQLPNAEMYNYAISSWARTADSGTRSSGAQKASAILERMVLEYQKEEARIQKINADTKAKQAHLAVLAPRPDIRIYTSVMDAWAKSKLPIGPSRALGILEELERISGFAQHTTTVAAAPVSSPGNDSKSVVTAARGEGTTQFFYVPTELTPDNHCYNTVMSAFAHSGQPDSPQMVIRLYRRLQQLQASIEGDHQNKYEPDTITYNLVINTIARTNPVNPIDAESVLRDMIAIYQKKRDQDGQNTPYVPCTVYPSSHTYNGIIQAWGNSNRPEAADRAQMILLALLGRSESRLDLPVLDDVDPDSHTFNSVIHCWAKSGRPEAGEKAEEVLSLMESRRSRSGQLLSVEPTIITYNSVMNAWSKSSGQFSRGTEGASRAEALLKQMLETTSVRPTAITYSTIIQAYTRSRSATAGENAERVLQQLEEAYESSRDPRLRPNDRCYLGVLQAWARQVDGNEIEAADRAEALLVRMKKSQLVVPQTEHLNAVLNCLSKSKAPNVVQRVRNLIITKEKDGWPFNLVTFNLAIAACTHEATNANQRREAFFTGLDFFNRLCEKFPPNEWTYTVMFDMLATHLPKKDLDMDRLRFSMDLFGMCWHAGLLSDNVLTSAQRFFPHETFMQMIGSKLSRNVRVRSRDLPRGWSRNTKRANTS